MSLVLQGKTSVYSVTHHFRNNLMVPTACFGRIFDFLGRARTNTHQNGYPRPPKNLGIFFHKTDPQSNSKNFLGYATFDLRPPLVRSPFCSIKNEHLSEFRQTDALFASLYACVRFFQHWNLYLSLHLFLCLLCWLSLFVKDNANHRYIINRIDQTSRSRCYEAIGPVKVVGS